MTLVCPRYDAPALEAKILSVELFFLGYKTSTVTLRRPDGRIDC
jgi:hypothetical protein